LGTAPGRVAAATAEPLSASNKLGIRKKENSNNLESLDFIIINAVYCVLR
jgi:hypothetical protein